MAQNMPERLTVSLQATHTQCTVTHDALRALELDLPAVDHNGVVSSRSLDLGHLCNHGNDTGYVGAAAIGAPVGHVELNHPVSLARL